MVDDDALRDLMQTIAAGDGVTAIRMLRDQAALAHATLGGGATRRVSSEFFLDACSTQIYGGDTALHVAAASYSASISRSLIAAGADVRARNRRGAEPLHTATHGGPGAHHWNPTAQVETIAMLIEAGADPNAPATGGVTPLHRAVRNRCSAAVRALLAAGADPTRRNDSGSTAIDLAHWTTGRGGTGSPEAKAEQEAILGMLSAATI